MAGCLTVLPATVAQAGCGNCGAHGAKTEAKASEGSWTCGAKARGTEAKACEGAGGCNGYGRGTQAKAEAAQSVVNQEVAKKIETYVDADKKAKGGYFLLYDEKNDRPIALTLRRIHDSVAMNAGEGEYIACAEFVDSTGKAYDVDFLVKQGGEAGLQVSEVAIHKEGGEHRYKWHRTEHGLERQNVGQAGAEAETAGEES